MNEHEAPKRGSKPPEDNAKSSKNKSHSNYHPPEEFYVPRDQIKPYFDSWEKQFDGMQSPNKMIMNALAINCTEDYLLMFRIFEQQIMMGYTIET